MITTTDPRTAKATETSIAETSEEEVAVIAERSAAAFTALEAFDREWRSGLLDALADALEADRAGLVATADSETALGLPRLDGELTRSAFQFRLFATAVREGGYLEAAIDHAGDTPMGPGPDIRRMLVPIGPVAVFGSSNFPFAFSVAGGDTASALAAGCPVVVKAHGSHPLTSMRSFTVLEEAATAYGAPAGTLEIVFGIRAGAALVAEARIRAVGFTGSLSGGKALMDIVAARDEPIPFYGELSSVNPLIITPGAAASRSDEIARGLFASFTGSAGQFCTKPGVAFVPRGPEGEALVGAIAALVADAVGQPLLNSRILESFGQIERRIVGDGQAREIAVGKATAGGFAAAPRLLAIDSMAMTADTTAEAFGPLLVVAWYDDLEQLGGGLAHVPDSLTATIHCEPHESELVERLLEIVRPHVGRLVFNGYPTGVRVGWSQHHGGPWPATNSLHTSVGVTAVRRFLRPLAWQDAPEPVLPAELREHYGDIPRRVDGVLRLPARSAR